MVGRLAGNSFVFVEFEEGGGVVEVAALALGAAGLDVAERVEALLELRERRWPWMPRLARRRWASTMSAGGW
jgi:hypothetical protein